MIEIPESKLRIIEKLEKSSDVFRILEHEIKTLYLNRVKGTLIIKILELKLGRKLSEGSFRKFIQLNKKEWLKEYKKNKLKRQRDE